MTHIRRLKKPKKVREKTPLEKYHEQRANWANMSQQQITAICSRTGQTETMYVQLIDPSEFFVQTWHLIGDPGLILHSSFTAINTHQERQDAYREIIQADLTSTASAISNQNLSLVQNKFNSNKFFSKEACDEAINAESLSILQYLVNNGFTTNSGAPCLACDLGLLDIVQWLWSVVPGDFNEECIYNAAVNGYGAICDYLISVSAPIDESAIAGACEGDHLSIVQSLYNASAPNDESAIRSCVENLAQSCLEYLWALPVPRPSDVMELAAQMGDLAQIQWLHANGGALSNAVYDEVVAYNHQSIISWMQGLGYPV